MSSVHVLRGSRVPRTSGVRVGMALLAAVVLLAVVGPWLAPHDLEQTIGIPFGPPSGDAWLGTDFLGRDVASRVMSGGWSVLLFAGAATLLAYAGGLIVGLAAGYSRSWLDSVLMRCGDIVLSFPALVFMLLLSTGLGRGIAPVVLATAIIQLPAIARIVRAAALEQAVRGYVEAAVARGESAVSILRREILPNITRPISADVGVRFALSVLLIAAVNFLGLGLQPPASDWGLMVSENRAGLDIALNPWAVLAPAVMLGMLTLSIYVVSDALAEGDR